MSKATIGGVVGAVIGFYVGGPTGAQIGFMIGSGIGASFDTIQGRKVGEMSSPRAQEGEPIPLVFGTARVTGRLMSCGEPSIVEEGGKGGPQVVNETAYLSYSILICESSELRNSLVGAVIMAIQNGKIVYDVTPNSVLTAAENAKWLENKRFYYGEESQGTDPTEEMIHGAGNVPAYRGLCRMVVTDEDVTQHGGGIPGYEFVVSRCAVEPPNFLLVTGQNKLGSDAVWCAATAGSEVDFVALNPDTGADIPNGIPAYTGGIWCVAGTDTARRSFDNRVTWQTIPLDSNGQSMYSLVGGAAGWFGRSDLSYNELVQSERIPSEFTNYTTTAPRTDDSGLWDVEEARQLFKAGIYYFAAYDRNLYRSLSPDGPWETLHDQISIVAAGGNPNGDCIVAWRDAVKIGSNTYFAVSFGFDEGTRRSQIRWSPDDGVTMPDANIVYEGEVALSDPSPMQLVDCDGTLVAYCPGEGVITSADGYSTLHATGLDGPNTLAAFAGRKIASLAGDPRAFVIGYGPDDGDKCIVFDSSTLVMGSPITMPIRSATGIAASSADDVIGGGIVIPDAPGHQIDPVTGAVLGPAQGIANACGMSLQDIIDDLDDRAGIPSANRDSDALAPFIVPGYAIDQFMTVAEAKEVLRPIYRFACPEYDDKIRYELFGRDTDFVVDPDDLIVTGEPSEKSVRGQTVEFPRRLHVQYVDPALGYKPMKQTDERTSPDIRVKGELVMGANVTLEADTAKQAAVVGLKVAWTEREDMGKEIALPIDYFAKTIPSHTYTLEGRRFRITDMRLSAGAIYLTSVYDRKSAFFSNAVGTVGPRPTAPGSQVRGPTISAVMNVPVLRDVDDKAGIYWGACGPMSGWRGAQLQISRDGGATWVNGPSVDAPAVMGELTATLPSADRYAQDNTNTLSLTLYRSETLDSTDQLGLLNERNAFAIIYPNNTVEVCQFQTATEIADRQWELTGLIRGRLDTAVGEHLAGAVFVLLNDAVRFVPIRADDIGKTLKFRAVSNGTDPDAAEVQDVTFASIESLREWQPYNLETESDGSGGYCFSWIGRARLGSDAYPVHSQFFDGYSLRLTDGVVIHDIETDEQSVCVNADEMEDIFGPGYGEPAASVVAKSTSSQQAYNGAAPTGWVALSGTWIEDPPGVYVLQADGSSQGLMYYDTLYPFSSGTFEASVDVIGPILAGFGGITVDFIDAAGNTFITENGSPTLTVTAAALAPFGTVANARVYLRALSGYPIPSPVTFSSLNVTVTP